MLLRFENECISIFYNITWAPRTNFFQGQELFFSILITKRLKMKLGIIRKKNAFDSPIKLPIKPILRLLVFKETMRKRRS